MFFFIMKLYMVEISIFFISVLVVTLIVRMKNRDTRINIPEEVPSLLPLKIRVMKGKGSKEAHFINVQFKGIIPVYSVTNLAFVVSIFTQDKNGRVEPVLSVIDTFQKPESKVFQDLTRVGEIHENTGCKNWTSVGVIPTEILQPAYGGIQKLKIHTMLVDLDSPPKDFDDKGIALISNDYIYNFRIKGYHEEGEYINKSRELSIQLGVAVAFSDGVFHEQEEVVLNSWIRKTIAPYSKEKRIQLQKSYDKALESAYQLAKDNKIEENEICKELYKIGEEVQNYEALELVHEIMFADKEEHPEEVKIISKIAVMLGIDDKELDYIRKHKIGRLDKALARIG
jgi:uncharacterized tellurite resistance protein B-like protein